jgi:phytoene dehydrogenase-like protein
MFHFVFKKFSEGAATLPANGMGAISAQLAEKAKAAKVEIRTNRAALCITKAAKGFVVECAEGNVNADTVIVAAEGPASKKLLSTLKGLKV